MLLFSNNNPFIVKLRGAESISIAFVESLLFVPELREDAPLAQVISRYKQERGMDELSAFRPPNRAVGGRIRSSRFWLWRRSFRAVMLDWQK